MDARDDDDASANDDARRTDVRNDDDANVRETGRTFELEEIMTSERVRSSPTNAATTTSGRDATAESKAPKKQREIVAARVLAEEGGGVGRHAGRKRAPITADDEGLIDDEVGFCDLFRARLCFWECSRDYCFASGSRCAAVRDATCGLICPEQAFVRFLGTTREREVAEYEDMLERKEFLGTLTADEERMLARRRREAAMYLRRRALARAPEAQRMEALRTEMKSKQTGGHRPAVVFKQGVGLDASRARDDASASASDEFGKEEEAERRRMAEASKIRFRGDSWPRRLRDSYSDSYNSDSHSDSYYSDSYTDSYSDSYSDSSGYSEYSDEYAPDAKRVTPEEDSVLMHIRRDVDGRPLVVGKDLAYPTEGLLTPGLERWQEYIERASAAGAMKEERDRERIARRDAQLHAAIRKLEEYAETHTLTEQDVEIRREALVSAHGRCVAEAETRARNRVEHARRKRALLESVNDPSKLLRKWAVRKSKYISR